MEQNIIIWLQSFSNKFLDLFFSGFSYVISWIGVLFVFLAIILFVNKKYGTFFGVGFIVTIIINYALKEIINRPRPYNTYPTIINKLSTIGKSFPSGHAVSVTFLVFTIIFLFKTQNKNGRFKLWKKLWFKTITIVFSTLFIILTYIARMYLGQHYLSDLIAGSLLSLFAFFVTYFLYNNLPVKTNTLK